MTGEAEATNALILLVAVCEQAMLALESLNPVSDGELLAAAERTRDLATAELRFGRLRDGASPASMS